MVLILENMPSSKRTSLPNILTTSPDLLALEKCTLAGQREKLLKFNLSRISLNTSHRFYAYELHIVCIRLLLLYIHYPVDITLVFFFQLFFILIYYFKASDKNDLYAGTNVSDLNTYVYANMYFFHFFFPVFYFVL